MEEFLFAAAEAQSPALPSTVTDAAARILSADSVYGPLLVVAGAAICVLALYIRSLHGTVNTERGQHSKAIDAIQEKRIEEAKLGTRQQADAEAVLSKLEQTLQSMGRTLDGLAAGLREGATKQDATALMVEKTLSRIEADIDALSKKVDRPLVQGVQGLVRDLGAGP